MCSNVGQIVDIFATAENDEKDAPGVQFVLNVKDGTNTLRTVSTFDKVEAPKRQTLVFQHVIQSSSEVITVELARDPNDNSNKTADFPAGQIQATMRVYEATRDTLPTAPGVACT